MWTLPPSSLSKAGAGIGWGGMRWGDPGNLLDSLQRGTGSVTFAVFVT